jgi:ornithine cyclodeaminase/alanine dehydrogenase-like protein (mu-crystallin family)
MRFITEDDVHELRWPDVLTAIRDAFAARGRYSMAERVMLEAPDDGAYLTMPCADDEGWFGVKQVSVLPRNPERGLPSVQAWYTLFDPDGQPAAAGSATLLTRLRTAAVSAVAADLLAPSAARALLVVGTGSLAPWLARAHLEVRPYETVWVWGRARDRAALVVDEVIAAFAGRAARPAVAVATDLAAVAHAADVISVATTSREALVRGEWLRPGQHLDLVGAFTTAMREADAAAVHACDVVVDDRTAARHEAGDLHAATREGWSWDAVVADLHEVVRDGGLRREPTDYPPHRPTLFKSVGLAFEDLAVARLLAR